MCLLVQCKNKLITLMFDINDLKPMLVCYGKFLTTTLNIDALTANETFYLHQHTRTTLIRLRIISKKN